jgi:hypothetical protein
MQAQKSGAELYLTPSFFHPPMHSSPPQYTLNSDKQESCRRSSRLTLATAPLQLSPKMVPLPSKSLAIPVSSTVIRWLLNPKWAKKLESGVRLPSWVTCQGLLVRV